MTLMVSTTANPFYRCSRLYDPLGRGGRQSVGTALGIGLPWAVKDGGKLDDSAPAHWTHGFYFTDGGGRQDGSRMNRQRGCLWDKLQEFLRQQYSRRKTNALSPALGQEGCWQASGSNVGTAVSESSLLGSLESTSCLLATVLRVTEYSSAYLLLWKATLATFLG